jgi:hypothetical protein
MGAFLNSIMDRVLHVWPPKGSNLPHDKLLRLKKTLYGLKQSPHLFNKALNSYLTKYGFVPLNADPCLYIYRKGHVVLLLLLHVDDQLIASNNSDALKQFKASLNKRFECKDGGNATYFLGIQIFRDRANQKLLLGQDIYATTLLEKHGMEESKAAKTPLPYDFWPVAATTQEYQEAQHLNFLSIAGSLLYLSCITWPNLAYPASVLCPYISKWSITHYKAAKHMLRYSLAHDTSVCFLTPRLGKGSCKVG